MMKKSLLALTVAALSANAFAVNLANTTSDAVDYASEITLPATLTNTEAGALNVTVGLGFSATAGVKRYVRFDLTNAKFAAAVDATTDLSFTTDGAATKLAPSVSTGGLADDNYVVIEITPDATLANTDTLTLALAKIQATGGNASVQYRLYETGVDAANATTNTLAQDSGTLFGFKSALVAKVTNKGAKQKIDVTQESKYFEGATAADTGDTSDTLGSLTIDADINVYLKSGAPAALASLVTADSKLELNGDFSAGAKNSGALDPKTAVLSDFVSTNTNTTVTSTKVTYALGTAKVVDKDVTFNVDGATALNTQSFTAKYIPVAAPGYTINSVDLGVLGNLEKNGSSKEVNLALNPNSIFRNYVRISNTSGLAGKFFVTVFADDGKSVALTLNEIANQPAELAARASTTQIDIKDVFAAAQAKGLSLFGNGKLRLLVEGEVPNLDVQSYTVATDNTSFSAF